MASTPTYSTLAGFQTVGGNMTLTNGAIPSTGVIVTPAMEVTPTVTELRLVHGSTIVTFPQVRVVKSTYFRRGANGPHLMRHLVVDNRWKWAEATIGGRYNRRRADGEIDASDKKTTKELFQMLFSAAGVGSPNLGQIPNGSFVEVDWGDASNVGVQMDMLANRLGLRICPTADGGVAVYPVGGGQGLPNASSMTNSGNAIEHEKPKTLQLVCGPTEYQTMWVTQAIAAESDGAWKKLDDVSWKPSAGWATIHPESMQGVAAASHELAIRTAYRVYQIEQLANGGTTVPGYDGDALTSLDQMLPLQEGLLESGDDWATTFPLAKTEEVRGVFATDNLVQENTTAADTEYTGAFEVDRERGMFIFERPVFKIDNDAPAEPWLYMTIKHHIRDKDGKLDSLIVEKDLGGPAGVVSVRRPDLVRRVVQKYQTTGSLGSRLGAWSESTLEDNKQDIESEANIQLNQMAAAYSSGRDITYPGMARIDLTGQIAQVRWDWGYGEGATTRASTFEFDWHSPSQAERKSANAVSALQAEVLKL